MRTGAGGSGTGGPVLTINIDRDLSRGLPVGCVSNMQSDCCALVGDHARFFNQEGNVRLWTDRWAGVGARGRGLVRQRDWRPAAPGETDHCNWLTAQRQTATEVRGASDNYRPGHRPDQTQLRSRPHH